jgi:hypothetical protein
LSILSGDSFVVCRARIPAKDSSAACKIISRRGVQFRLTPLTALRSE